MSDPPWKTFIRMHKDFSVCYAETPRSCGRAHLPRGAPNDQSHYEIEEVLAAEVRELRSRMARARDLLPEAPKYRAKRTKDAENDD